MSRNSKPPVGPKGYNQEYLEDIRARVWLDRLDQPRDKETVLRDPERGIEFARKRGELYDAVVRSVLDAVGELGYKGRGESYKRRAG